MTILNNFASQSYEGPKAVDVASCDKCKCSWFEQISVKQFKNNHSTVLGQTVPAAGEYEFVVLRCIKCGEKYQPNILVGQQNKETELYNQFLDILEDKPVAETK